LRFRLFCVIEIALQFLLHKKRSAMDGHSRVMKMLHKCNRARRENAASGILSCFRLYVQIRNFFYPTFDIIKL